MKETTFLAVNGKIWQMVGSPDRFESGLDFPSTGDFLESTHKVQVSDEFSAMLWLMNPGYELGNQDNYIFTLDVMVALIKLECDEEPIFAN